VVSNVDAAPHSDPDVIKSILAQQLTAPVQWETSIRTLLDRGLERSYEIGPNKVCVGWGGGWGGGWPPLSFLPACLPGSQRCGLWLVLTLTDHRPLS
jgi:hypothetical protein